MYMNREVRDAAMGRLSYVLSEHGPQEWGYCMYCMHKRSSVMKLDMPAVQ